MDEFIRKVCKEIVIPGNEWGGGDVVAGGSRGHHVERSDSAEVTQRILRRILC